MSVREVIEDTPRLEPNCIIMYSNATGHPDSELWTGIQPSVRCYAEVTCATEFEPIGKDVFYGEEPPNKAPSDSSSGLYIVPELSENKKKITFRVIIFKCNMTLTDYFDFTVKTKGDGKDYKPCVKELSVKIMCYGHDRPYLENFKEYNCTRSISPGHNIPRTSLRPASVNALANWGVGALNLEGSAFSIRNVMEDNGLYQVYYEGAPGKPDTYGIEVFAQTYEGGINAFGEPSKPPPANPFPGGQSSESLLLTCYQDYFSDGDICSEIPEAINMSNELDDMTAPFQTLYAVYQGSVQEFGGVFLPVWDKDKKFMCYEHICKMMVSRNVNYFVEHRVVKTSNKWLLTYRAYLADSENAINWSEIWDLINGLTGEQKPEEDQEAKKPKWEEKESFAVINMDVPVLIVTGQGDNKKVEKKAVKTWLSVPFFGQIETDGTRAEGDGKYFIQGAEFRFFNSAHLIDDSKFIDPIPVYLNNSGKILYQQHVIEDADKNKVITIFPDIVEDWEVWDSRNNRYYDFKDADIEEVNTSVAPYAPPKANNDKPRVRDYALPIATLSEIDELFDEVLDDSVLVPHGENPTGISSGNYSSNLFYAHDDQVARLWKRYPFHRQVKPSFGDTIIARVKGTMHNTYTVNTDSFTRELEVGHWQSELGPSKTYHTVRISNLLTTTDRTNKSSFVTIDDVTTLDGVITSTDGNESRVRSFCGMIVDPSAVLEWPESKKEIIEDDSYESSWLNYDWEDADYDESGERVAYGKQVLTQTGGGEYPSRTYKRVETVESAAGSCADLHGFMDVYLHYGQGGPPGKRGIVQTASVCAPLSIYVDDVVETTSVREERDGEVTVDTKSERNTTRGDSVWLTHSEAYPRIGLPNSIGIQEKQPSWEPDFDENIDEYVGFSSGNNDQNAKAAMHGCTENVWDWKCNYKGDYMHASWGLLPTYSVEGNGSQTEVYLGRVAGNLTAEFHYNRGDNRASCSAYLSRGRSYKDKYIRTLSESSSWRSVMEGTDASGYQESSTRDYRREATTLVERHHIQTTYESLEITPIKYMYKGLWKYRIVKNKDPFGEYKYRAKSYTVHTSESVTPAIWTDVYEEKLVTPDDSEHEVIDYVAILSAREVKNMYDQFLAQWSPISYDFDTSQYDYYETYADFSDSPLYPDSLTDYYSVSTTRRTWGKDVEVALE